MSWKYEPVRHSLASYGVKTKEDDDPVFVGGRDSPRLSKKKPEYESGKRYGTDLKNCFHTSLRKDVPMTFMVENDNKTGYKLELNLDDIPDYRILRQEDWSAYMAYFFHMEEEIPYNFLVKERPDMREYLNELGYEKGDSITIEDLDKGIFDVFAYPSEEVNDEMRKIYDISILDEKIAYEGEVSIFNEELLQEAWDNREEISIEEFRRACRKREGLEDLTEEEYQEMLC